MIYRIKYNDKDHVEYKYEWGQWSYKFDGDKVWSDIDFKHMPSSHRREITLQNLLKTK